MPRGSAPGERRGGRAKGTPNKLTVQVREFARRYGQAAIRKAAAMAGLIKGIKPAESEQVRLAAINTVLDRAYGKPTQFITGDENGAPVQIAAVVRQIIEAPSRDDD